jgi:hypothetical protein
VFSCGDNQAANPLRRARTQIVSRRVSFDLMIAFCLRAASCIPACADEAFPELRLPTIFRLRLNRCRTARHRSSRPHLLQSGGDRRRFGRHQVVGCFGRIADAILVLAKGSWTQGIGLRGRWLALGLQRPDIVGRNGRSQFAGLPEVRPTIRRRQSNTHLGRRRLDLGFAVRSTSVRLRGSVDQRKVRRRPAVQVRQRHVFLNH